ncbi:hypothetical protein ACQ3VF_26210 [Bacillus toyonensis]|uniref:hypothetical protein n=1 Tax=Bacillus toyonensis TaxID=155322 RepID=UPI003D303435
MTKTYQEIVSEMKKHRSQKHWSKQDLKMIVTAQNTGDWSLVQESKLYNKYSGEYCSLLEVLHKVERVVL